MRLFKISSILALSLVFTSAHASLTVPMTMVGVEGPSAAIGTITVDIAKCGIMLTPNLHGLPPGAHGFHIHQLPSCDNKAMSAGGHLDPKKTEQHDGPYSHKGHLGDLPMLYVDKDGNATLPMLAPNLTMADFRNHALMIHENGDNYSDTPEKLGGGGARIACGVIAQ